MDSIYWMSHRQDLEHLIGRTDRSAQFRRRRFPVLLLLMLPSFLFFVFFFTESPTGWHSIGSRRSLVGSACGFIEYYRVLLGFIWLGRCCFWSSSDLIWSYFFLGFLICSLLFIWSHRVLPSCFFFLGGGRVSTCLLTWICLPCFDWMILKSFFTGLNKVRIDSKSAFTWFYWVLPGFYRVLPSFNGFPLGFSGFFSGFSGFY